MKIQRPIIISVLTTFAICTGLLVIVGIIFLPAELASPEKSAQEEIFGIDYAVRPENCGLSIIGDNGNGAFVYLDFESITTHIYLFSENYEAEVEKLPYRTDYRFFADNSFTGRLCDRIGGIDIYENGKNQRYFSASLTEFCTEKPDYDKMLKISRAFFEKISNTGLSSDDFMFIIEYTKSDLPYSRCYDWIGSVKELFCNCIYH